MVGVYFLFFFFFFFFLQLRLQKDRNIPTLYEKVHDFHDFLRHPVYGCGRTGIF